MRPVLYISFWIVVPLAAAVAFGYLSPTFYGHQDFDFAHEGLRHLVTAGCIALGVFFRSAHKVVTNVSQTAPWKVLLASIFRPKTVAIAMLISPVVFALIYSAIDALPSLFVAALFAFENGFFFQTLFASREESSS